MVTAVCPIFALLTISRFPLPERPFERCNCTSSETRENDVIQTERAPFMSLLRQLSLHQIDRVVGKIRTGRYKI